MNYKKIYYDIINFRLSNPLIDEYTENHHIIPRSLGGSNDKDNLVNLSAREHFICHLLLTKIYKEGSIEWIKMIKAFMRMYSFSPCQTRYSNNKWYEYLKKNYSKAQSLNQSGKNNSSYGTVWISNIEQKKSIKIKVEELDNYLLKGWIKRRIQNWDSYDIKDGKNISNYICPSRRNIYEKTKKHIKEQINLYEYYWSIYKEKTFNDFVKITGYNKSLENLIYHFHRYVKDYIPQQGNNKKK